MVVSDLFSALGDPTRLHIVDMLHARPMAAGEIAEEINSMSRPAVVKHITILREAGLIETSQEGRQRINSLTPAAFDALATWLGGVNGGRSAQPRPPTKDKIPAVKNSKGLFSTKPSKLLSAKKKRRWDTNS